MRIDASGHRLPPPRVRAPAASDPAAQKGGWRVPFGRVGVGAHTRNGVIAPLRNGESTGREVKSTRRPPFPAPPPRTATSGAPQGGSSPRGPDGVVLLEPGDGARNHPARTRWRARAATAGAVDQASRGNRHHAKGFTRGASCRGGIGGEIVGWAPRSSLNLGFSSWGAGGGGEGAPSPGIMRIADVRARPGEGHPRGEWYRVVPGCGCGGGGGAGGGPGGGEAADRDGAGHRPGHRALTGPGALAQAPGGARPGQDRGGPGPVRGPGRRSPVGPGRAAQPGGALRAGRLRPHGLPPGQDPGRGRGGRRGGRGGGPGGGAAAGVVPGRGELPDRGDQRRVPAGDRRGRDPGGGALRQGGGGADVQGRVRLPPPDRLVRPRGRRGRAVRGDHAAAGQRGGEHRRRPHRGDLAGPGPGGPGIQTGQESAGAHRRGRGHQGDRGVPRPPPGVLQRGVQAPRPHARHLREDPQDRLGAGVQRRRRPQGGGGRRRDPPACWT